MATPYKIHVSPTNTGLLNVKQTDASATKVTELLQEDHDTHHVFFNARGFHNHIVHHLLTLYGTGATPDTLQAAYDDNRSYQLPAQKPHTGVVEELQADWSAHAPKYLGLGKHYPDFLRFYQAEMEKRGWEEVVKEFLFKGDERADDLFSRLFAGIMHPIIQLMYGIEWKQPAIVAQGLANASVHGNPLGDFFLKTEKAAAASPNKANDNTPYNLPELFAAAAKNQKLATSPHWDDDNRLYDGVLKRAFDEAVELCSRVRVRAGELDERTVEMLHTASWVAASAAWHPPHMPKYDFLLIHQLNSSPIFLSINQQTWIPTPMKTRILEWKIRSDIIQYIARRCPLLATDPIRQYTKPRSLHTAAAAAVSDPADLVPSFHKVRDDGHTIKVVRAMLLARRLSEPYADRAWVRIKGDEMWRGALYMLLDGAAEGSGAEWVRSAGFEEAWEDVPKAQL